MCKSAEYREITHAISKRDKEDGLLLLARSPKQIEWTSQIRNNMIQSIYHCANMSGHRTTGCHEANALVYIHSISSAEWFINNKHLRGTELVELGEKYSAMQENIIGNTIYRALNQEFILEPNPNIRDMDQNQPVYIYTDGFFLYSFGYINDTIKNIYRLH